MRGKLLFVIKVNLWLTNLPLSRWEVKVDFEQRHTKWKIVTIKYLKQKMLPFSSPSAPASTRISTPASTNNGGGGFIFTQPLLPASTSIVSSHGTSSSSTILSSSTTISHIQTPQTHPISPQTEIDAIVPEEEVVEIPQWRLWTVEQVVSLVAPKRNKTADKPVWTKSCFSTFFGIICNRIMNQTLTSKLFSFDGLAVNIPRTAWSTKVGENSAQRDHMIAEFTADAQKYTRFMDIVEEEFNRARINPTGERSSLQDEALPSGEASLNVMARIVHLAKDPLTAGILEEIFSVTPAVREAERRHLDSHLDRSKQKWNTLAIYVNDGQIFNPLNPFLDIPKLSGISPNLAPQVSFTGEMLKETFNKLRTKFTIYYDNFHKSGNYAEDEDHAMGDEEFITNFCIDNNIIFFYMYLLFDRTKPRFFTREAADGTRLEEGIAATTGNNNSKKRRQIENYDENDEALQLSRKRNVVITFSEEDRERENRLAQSALERDNAVRDRMNSESTWNKITRLKEKLKDRNVPVARRNKLENMLDQLENSYFGLSDDENDSSSLLD